MEQKRVSVVKFANNRGNIARAVAEAGGFHNLRPGDRVLLKPNLVMWDSVYPFPKFGVLTSSLLLEEMVKLLREFGCTKITIGEGSITDPGIGSDTKSAFSGLGYQVLQDKYGVELVDFNDGPFAEVDFNGYSLNISQHALETDFLINLPVLKTHSSTKVSLGLKNLKGCLHIRSKMFCHHKELSLDSFVSHLADVLKPALTVIDGIYALEKGPVMNGRAYRTDVIIASTDPCAADTVGARILGFDPAEIIHLAEYAKRHAISSAEIEVVGERLEEVTTLLAWDWDWLPDGSGPDAFARAGITDICFPKYDNTLCSGCSYLNNYLLISLMGAFTRQRFGGMEFLGGKNSRSGGGYSKTFLFGKCAVHANQNNPCVTEAIPIRGCPPAKQEILQVLQSHGIPADDKAYIGYRASLYKRYHDNPDFQEDHFQIVP